MQGRPDPDPQRPRIPVQPHRPEVCANLHRRAEPSAPLPRRRLPGQGAGGRGPGQQTPNQPPARRRDSGLRTPLALGPEPRRSPAPRAQGEAEPRRDAAAHLRSQGRRPGSVQSALGRGLARAGRTGGGGGGRVSPLSEPERLRFQLRPDPEPSPRPPATRSAGRPAPGLGDPRAACSGERGSRGARGSPAGPLPGPAPRGAPPGARQARPRPPPPPTPSPARPFPSREITKPAAAAASHTHPGRQKGALLGRRRRRRRRGGIEGFLPSPAGGSNPPLSLGGSTPRLPPDGGGKETWRSAAGPPPPPREKPAAGAPAPLRDPRRLRAGGREKRPCPPGSTAGCLPACAARSPRPASLYSNKEMRVVLRAQPPPGPPSQPRQTSPSPSPPPPRPLPFRPRQLPFPARSQPSRRPSRADGAQPPRTRQATPGPPEGVAGAQGGARPGGGPETPPEPRAQGEVAAPCRSAPLGASPAARRGRGASAPGEGLRGGGLRSHTALPRKETRLGSGPAPSPAELQRDLEALADTYGVRFPPAPEASHSPPARLCTPTGDAPPMHTSPPPRTSCQPGLQREPHSRPPPRGQSQPWPPKVETFLTWVGSGSRIPRRGCGATPAPPARRGPPRRAGPGSGVASRRPVENPAWLFVPLATFALGPPSPFGTPSRQALWPGAPDSISPRVPYKDGTRAAGRPAKQYRRAPCSPFNQVKADLNGGQGTGKPPHAGLGSRALPH
uniref:basic proline-rich protein-like n=1 Tax=Euleptes europaea TaxID=460621 RepID=UPI00254266BF|nr:basic proline-rich protein-like [Euleptes europaea]